MATDDRDLFAAINALDGAHYEVMLRDPGYTIDGEPGLDGLVGWSRLQVLPAADCQHGETACVTCAPEWAQDYFVRVIAADGTVLLASPGTPLERGCPRARPAAEPRSPAPPIPAGPVRLTWRSIA